MRTWSRCAVETLCGNCKKPILFGHAMQTIASDPSRGIKATKVRCTDCAEGTPPKDLPAPVVNRGEAIKPHKLLPTRAGEIALPFDFKRAAGGER